MEVVSSNILDISISDEGLLVTFKSGDEYIYYGAENHYDEIIMADSKGEYLNKHIKGIYKYKKIN